MSTPVRLPVTYLFSRDCPSHEEGLRLLAEAASAARVELAVEPVEVTSDAQAAALGFVGSPTYLAGGRDLFPVREPAHEPRADSCRAYARPGGRIGPLPARDDLAGALAAAARAVPA